MAKVTFYRQCRLARPTPTGEVRQMSWIPDPFAVPGRVVRLRAADKTWDDGWTVTEVGRTRLAEADLPDFHVLSKAHLKATGDADTA